ncbi:hypothetical protein OI70_18855 [Dickeya fangzhongdai]|uniref:ParB family protein n=1 Tax=Dickeya fangzhongdai TaxID=1778540 RepID=UPI0005734B7B|nr:ParB family protein [Dickeya fangzhongdai]KHN52868.1 hypothetical protein OI70_18855 [Dickeya fangzhongdai]
MPDISAQTLVAKLSGSDFTSSDPAASAVSDPITDTPIMVTLDELRPYELDPRLTRNPLYGEIKASMLERGLDTPPPITRRPGAPHYIIRNGGNTRLAILRELWSETKDERFYRILCLFRPWPERGEIIALTGHLAEDELHGGLSFIERALGVAKARELYEQETGKPLSQSELARRLKADGYPVSQPHISRMQEAIQYLLPAIPNMLYAGLGRHQIEQLTGLRRATERFWNSHQATKHRTVAFPTLFQDVLALFDSAPGHFSVQRVQDELIGQMADLLQMKYDTLAFEITDTDKRWQLLETPPSDDTEVPAPQYKAKSPIQISEPASVALVVSAKQPDHPATAITTACNEPTEEHVRQEWLKEHIASPAVTTERLASIQQLVANHTGEAHPDFGQNVLQSISVQAGRLYPISDIWYIELGLDTPEHLRIHIAQFAQEIASEAGLSNYIIPCDDGIGFRCQFIDSNKENPSQANTILMLLNALSAPYLPIEQTNLVISGIGLSEQLVFLLQGVTPYIHAEHVASRFSDTALVKLFRLLRLSRRLLEHQTGLSDKDSAMVTS